MEEDPLCQMWHLMRSNVLGVASKDEALAAAQKAVELDSNFWFGWAQLGLLWAHGGRHAEALHCAEKAMSAAPWSPYSIGLMAAMLATTGQAEGAGALLDALRGDAYGGPVGLLVEALARGDADGAVGWARMAAGQRFPTIIPVVLRPFEPTLRRSAEWPEVLRGMNLSPV
jgi:tetratricopeptide (TPR) repeat protein